MVPSNRNSKTNTTERLNLKYLELPCYDLSIHFSDLIESAGEILLVATRNDERYKQSSCGSPCGYMVFRRDLSTSS